MVDLNGWAASTPASSRIVVPELRASSVATGAVRPPRPRPSISTDVIAEPVTMATPSAARQASVAAQSAPGANPFELRERPRARAASMA